MAAHPADHLMKMTEGEIESLPEAELRERVRAAMEEVRAHHEWAHGMVGQWKAVANGLGHVHHWGEGDGWIEAADGSRIPLGDAIWERVERDAECFLSHMRQHRSFRAFRLPSGKPATPGFEMRRWLPDIFESLRGVELVPVDAQADPEATADLPGVLVLDDGGTMAVVMEMGPGECGWSGSYTKADEGE